MVMLNPFSLLASPPLPSSELASWLSPFRTPLYGAANSDARVRWPLSSQNVYVFAATSSASENLPMGLGAQLGMPTVEMSAVKVFGEAGVGVVVGGGGGGVLEDDDDDFFTLDGEGELDGGFALFDVCKVVAADVGLLVTALGAGILRTCPGCRSLTETLGFAASRAATETPCSAATLARVSPGWTLIAFICGKRIAATIKCATSAWPFAERKSILSPIPFVPLCLLFYNLTHIRREDRWLS